jgi:hypothetical protein
MNSDPYEALRTLMWRTDIMKSTDLQALEALNVLSEHVSTIDYEYGVVFMRDKELHRGPMSRVEAEKWIEDFANDCPPGNKIREVYRIVRRPVGEWEEA